jgi:hypothetical protein
MGGTSAQWTTLRGTSWRPGGAEMRGLSRVRCMHGLLLLRGHRRAREAR